MYVLPRSLADDSYLRIFLDATRHLSADERGTRLEEDTFLAQLHDRLSLEGQTTAATSDSPSGALIEECNLHFVTFIDHRGDVYELDGTTAGPLVHRAPTPDPRSTSSPDRSLLHRACRVIRENYVDRPVEQASRLHYTVLALVHAMPGASD
jgi:hypothetical protein